jgi:hypothetical protein
MHLEDKNGCGPGTDSADFPIFRLERVDLEHSTAMATRTGSATIRVQFQKFSSTLVAPPSGGCTSDAARAQAATLPCASSEILLATRVN